jgi:hypothetical protein
MMGRLALVNLSFCTFCVAACSQGDEQPLDPAVTASETLATAADTVHAPELAGLMDGLASAQGAGIPGGQELFRCDPNPQITYIEVCGKSFPSSIHASWTWCAGRGGSAQGGDPRRIAGERNHPRFDSSGTVDITTTVTPSSADCGQGTVLSFAKTTNFQITRGGDKGGMTISGSSTATSQRQLGEMTFTESNRLDITRAATGANGVAGREVHLTGTVTTAFDRSSGAATRTLNGTLSAQFGDGTTGTILLANLVRERGCHFPTSGTVTRTLANGTSHELAFGPACGQATLDGKAISLFGHGGKHGHRGWGGRGPHHNDGAAPE